VKLVSEQEAGSSNSKNNKQRQNQAQEKGKGDLSATALVHHTKSRVSVTWLEIVCGGGAYPSSSHPTTVFFDTRFRTLFTSSGSGDSGSCARDESKPNIPRTPRVGQIL
jgi:hypothetical protein